MIFKAPCPSKLDPNFLIGQVVHKSVAPNNKILVVIGSHRHDPNNKTLLVIGSHKRSLWSTRPIKKLGCEPHAGHTLAKKLQ